LQNKKTKRREGKKRTLGGGGFSSFSSSSSLVFLLFLFLLSSSSSSSSFRRCTCVFDEKSFFTLIRIVYQALVLFLCGSLVYFSNFLLLIFLIRLVKP
jgi:hypothetical protein